jgi:hypothetical protein
MVNKKKNYELYAKNSNQIPSKEAKKMEPYERRVKAKNLAGIIKTLMKLTKRINKSKRGQNRESLLQNKVEELKLG